MHQICKSEGTSIPGSNCQNVNSHANFFMLFLLGACEYLSLKFKSNRDWPNNSIGLANTRYSIFLIIRHTHQRKTANKLIKVLLKESYRAMWNYKKKKQLQKTDVCETIPWTVDVAISLGRCFTTGVLIVAISVSFESSSSAGHFPTTCKGESLSGMKAITNFPTF